LKRVAFSLDARAYINAEVSYLKLRSPAAAARFRASLNDLKRNLSDFPGLGHPNAETVAGGIFRFVMGEYLVDYEVIDEVVIVITIRHGRQRPPEQPFDTDDDYEVT
jgi:plasmid stabilization system protein ParE